ncbi:hypothetical protein PHMEG_00010772 [Phytophthora megakarya]|uniref:Uncharacterized protein n=1 Tax=Phytophthora megakarya TaxID=4795 RepID=A0A225WD63_9STRA|nr:hypothetical protein PHMEG_00010772 [Phytophthora megakarya]
MTYQDKTTDAVTTETGASTALRAPYEATAASGSTTAEVVDDTADYVAWTETPARATSDLVRSRAAKRKTVSSETKKGKKKLVRDDVAPAPHAEVSSVAEERAPSTQESAAATTVGLPVSMASTTPRRSTGFDLTEFMSSFNPGVWRRQRSSVGSPAAWRTARSHTVAKGAPVVGVRTELNDQGDLPSGTVVELSCASFLEQAKKAKGEYIPPQAHVLVATRMFKGLSPSEGKSVSPMSFALGLREAESLGFKTTRAVLMALFSGRLGSRGLTILHYHEEDEQTALEDGSCNGNFSSDFSPSAALPPASTSCRLYEDILDGIHGPNRIGEAMWHDHMLL